VRPEHAAAALAAILCPGGLAQDPTFDDSISLLGSCEYVAEDWVPTKGGVVPDPRMAKGGLRVLAEEQGGFSVIQYDRSFAPASGMSAAARFRVRYDHPQDIQTMVGFLSDVGGNSPFVTQPENGAYFLQKPDGLPLAGRLLAVTVRDGEEETELLVTGIPEGARYDLVIEIAGTDEVTFYWKPSGESSWSSHEDDNVPTADPELRFSAAAGEATTNGFVELAIFEFEYGPTSE
jgi:hypothetical protein